MFEPRWSPLEKVLPLDECAQWMWMGRVEHGDRTIEQYKHSDTRRYLNLDQDGQPWIVRFIYADWDPWCGVPLEDVPPPTVEVEPTTLAAALEWALS